MANRDNNDKELVYLPLGGSGEIGMNCYLYGVGSRGRRQWLMVDLGITFPGPMEPGVDVIFPDISFIEEERQDLVAIVLTHAHEDHFGAVVDLAPRLDVPIYATPFTATLLKLKAMQFGTENELQIKEVELGSRMDLKAFDIEFVTMAHSIPEPNALVIRTEAGVVLHSGDWKIDHTPIAGPGINLERIKEVGDEGVDVLICDSTNAVNEGRSPSESDVSRTLHQLFKETKNRIAVTTFASNVARIRSVAEAARASGREIVAVGRAMRRIIEVARDTGYLDPAIKFVGEEDFGYLPRDKVVLLCTGSQGEARAAMARIARDEHPNVTLNAGDTVIFSSRTIPGNERSVNLIQNRLLDLGVDLITDREARVHVSGHPRRDELAEYYQAVKPTALVPMHGEAMHLKAQLDWAEQCGIGEGLLVCNGEMARILPGPLTIIDEVPSGRLFRDGHLIIPSQDKSVRDRRNLSHVGAVFVTAVLTKKGRLIGEPQITLSGVPDETAESEDMDDIIYDSVLGVINSIPKPRRKNQELLAEAIRRGVRSTVREIWGKKTQCLVSLTFLDPRDL
ncbi:MAG: ribonuclease J [Methyloligellaceae bacterium]